MIFSKQGCMSCGGKQQLLHHSQLRGLADRKTSERHEERCQRAMVLPDQCTRKAQGPVSDHLQQRCEGTSSENSQIRVQCSGHYSSISAKNSHEQPRNYNSVPLLYLRQKRLQLTYRQKYGSTSYFVYTHIIPGESSSPNDALPSTVSRVARLKIRQLSNHARASSWHDMYAGSISGGAVASLDLRRTVPRLLTVVNNIAAPRVRLRKNPPSGVSFTATQATKQMTTRRTAFSTPGFRNRKSTSKCASISRKFPSQNK